MKLLITSGGTTEPIDSVRGITNHATGWLGKIMAETALTAGHKVTLVTTKSAAKPAHHPNLDLVIVSDVASLMTVMEPLVKSHDACIHSMAVSDYTPVYMTDIEELEQATDVRQLLTKSNREGKISSQAEHQVLFLRKTPKVIRHIKVWNPAIRLVGFKLLVNVSVKELLSVAKQSLERHQADYILANDLTDITADQHKAYLVGRDQVELAMTKPAIAKLILERVTAHD